MFKLIGILRKEEAREYTKKDGSQGKSRTLYVEPEGSIYPVRVNCSDMERVVGKQGEKVSLDVEVFSYTIADGKRKRAFTDVYIPRKK